MKRKRKKLSSIEIAERANIALDKLVLYQVLIKDEGSFDGFTFHPRVKTKTKCWPGCLVSPTAGQPNG